MKKKPIDLMLLYFGERNDICGNCCNLISVRYNDRKVRKCLAYGGLHSSKADWAKRWPACGLFGKVIRQSVVSNTAKSMFFRIGIVKDDDCKGQIGIFEDMAEQLGGTGDAI